MISNDPNNRNNPGGDELDNSLGIDQQQVGSGADVETGLSNNIESEEDLDDEDLEDDEDIEDEDESSEDDSETA